MLQLDDVAALEARVDAWEAVLSEEADRAFLSAWAVVAAEAAALADSPTTSLLESAEGRCLHGRLALHQRRHLSLSERTAAEHLLRTAPVGDRRFRDQRSSNSKRARFRVCPHTFLCAVSFARTQRPSG